MKPTEDRIRAVTRVVLATYLPEGSEQSTAENGRIIVPPHLFREAEEIAIQIIAAIPVPDHSALVARLREDAETVEDMSDFGDSPRAKLMNEAADALEGKSNG